MKKILFVFTAVLSVKGFLLSASLDLNTDYRLRGLSYRNPDYNDTIRDNQAYYEQQIRFSVEGSPVEGVRIVVRIQSLGLGGGSTAYTLVGGTTTARYPETGNQPWIENAYIQLNDIHELPLSLSIGRQPFLYGAGLIFTDDALGLTAVKAVWQFTEMLTLDVFSAKILENRFNEHDKDVYGIVATSKKSRSKWMAALFYEKDRSGTLINASATEKIDTYFLEYYHRKELRGAFYSVDIAIQRGTVDFSDPTVLDQKYRGDKNFEIAKIFDYLKPMGYIFEGGLQSIGNEITGPMEVHAAWGVGTGDDLGSVIENEAFLPTFGHRYDGLQRTGFGEYYAATLYDAYPALPAGYSGLQIIKFGGNISPFAALKLGIDYFIYDAQQAAPGGAKELGREIDFTLRYPYSSFVIVETTYALFFPKDGINISGSRAERLMLGITGKF